MEIGHELHVMAAQRAISAGQVAAGDFDIGLAYWEEYQRVAARALKQIPSPLVEGAMQVASDEPAGDRGDAALKSYEVALAHMLVAFPEAGFAEGQSGWGVNITDREDNWPDEDTARDVLSVIGAGFDPEEGPYVDGDPEMGFLVTLPTDYVTFLLRTEYLYVPITWKGKEWRLYAELDPR